MSGGERGSVGGLLLAGMLGAIAAVVAGGVVFISWFALIRDAEQAAELSALAAAGAAVRGEDACVAARLTAGRNGVEVRHCEVAGEGRQVVAEVAVVAVLSPSPPVGPTEVLRSATAGNV